MKHVLTCVWGFNNMCLINMLYNTRPVREIMSQLPDETAGCKKLKTGKGQQYVTWLFQSCPVTGRATCGVHGLTRLNKALEENQRVPLLLGARPHRCSLRLRNPLSPSPYMLQCQPEFYFISLYFISFYYCLTISRFYYVVCFIRW